MREMPESQPQSSQGSQGHVRSEDHDGEEPFTELSDIATGSTLNNRRHTPRRSFAGTWSLPHRVRASNTNSEDAEDDSGLPLTSLLIENNRNSDAAICSSGTSTSNIGAATDTLGAVSDIVLRAEPDTFCVVPDILRAEPDLFRAVSDMLGADPATFRALSDILGEDPAQFLAVSDILRAEPDTVSDMYRADPAIFRALSDMLSVPSNIQADSQKRLRFAIFKRDLPGIQQLLSEGVSLNHLDSLGRTPLAYSLYCMVGAKNTTEVSSFGARKVVKYFRYCPFKIHISKWWCNSAIRQRPADWRCRCSSSRTAPNIETEPYATESLAKEIIQEILKSFVKSISNNKIRALNTSISIAIATGDLEIVKALLDAGANIEILNDSKETVLHLAAKCKEDKILKYFLDNYNIRNSLDENKMAPIHHAAKNGAADSVILLLRKFGKEYLDVKTNQGRTVWHEIAHNPLFRENQYFIEAMDREFCMFEGINEPDNVGVTPLCRAASLNHKALSGLFLRHGAALITEGAKEPIVDVISKTFSNPLQFFEDLFDDCVHTEELYYAFVNYEILSDNKNMSQIRILEELVDYGHSSLLQHPMVESLICLKWKRLVHLFYIIVGIYGIFLGSFNTFVVVMFNQIDMNRKFEALNSSSEPSISDTPNVSVENCGSLLRTSVALLYMSISVLFIQECFWIYLRKSRYYRDSESWVRLCGLALAFVVPMVLDCAPAPGSLSWQRLLVCVTMLLVWLQAMLLLSRLPGWGFYAFERVALNLLKIFAKSACIIISFAACFMILYKSKPPFNGLFSAIIKTLVMMSSEFDYEDLFDESHNELEEYTRLVVLLLFVGFVIFIAIVLMNFMIGVAVSDINELDEIGNIRRLEKQVELLGNLEGLDEVLGKWRKEFSHARYQRFMCIMANNPHIPFYVAHSNRECHRNGCKPIFTSKLYNAIFTVARKRKQSLNTFDELRDAVVGVIHHPKCPDEDETSTATTLNSMNDRIKSIEHADMETKQSIDGLKSDVKKILSIVSLKTRKRNGNGYRSKIKRRNTLRNKDI